MPKSMTCSIDFHDGECLRFFFFPPLSSSPLTVRRVSPAGALESSRPREPPQRSTTRRCRCRRWRSSRARRRTGPGTRATRRTTRARRTVSCETVARRQCSRFCGDWRPKATACPRTTGQVRPCEEAAEGGHLGNAAVPARGGLAVGRADRRAGRGRRQRGVHGRLGCPGYAAENGGPAECRARRRWPGGRHPGTSRCWTRRPSRTDANAFVGARLSASSTGHLQTRSGDGRLLTLTSVRSVCVCDPAASTGPIHDVSFGSVDSYGYRSRCIAPPARPLMTIVSNV